MRHFKTSLLWLAFLFLLSQSWIDTQENILFGFIFRLIPSLCLLIWFILSLFVRQALTINALTIPKWALLALKTLRPLASTLIILGALFKIMHWSGGFYFLIFGIGTLAIYSTILNFYSNIKSEQNIEILDDLKY